MTTTSWTSADVAALESAIKRGTKSVAYATGRVEYHSLAEMLTLLDRMRSDVAGTDAGNQVVYCGRVQ